MRQMLAALFLLATLGPAGAQSDPGLAYGQVPTAGQWNSYFASKADFPITSLPTALAGPLLVTGDIYATGVVSTGVVEVADLPPCDGDAEGTRLAVSDADTPTFLGVLTGGSTTHTPAYCDGTDWVAY